MSFDVHDAVESEMFMDSYGSTHRNAINRLGPTTYLVRFSLRNSKAGPAEPIDADRWLIVLHGPSLNLDREYTLVE